MAETGATLSGGQLDDRDGDEGAFFGCFAASLGGLGAAAPARAASATGRRIFLGRIPTAGGPSLRGGLAPHHAGPRRGGIC